MGDRDIVQRFEIHSWIVGFSLKKGSVYPTGNLRTLDYVLLCGNDYFSGIHPQKATKTRIQSQFFRCCTYV